MKKILYVLLICLLSLTSAFAEENELVENVYTQEEIEKVDSTSPEDEIMLISEEPVTLTSDEIEIDSISNSNNVYELAITIRYDNSLMSDIIVSLKNENGETVNDIYNKNAITTTSDIGKAYFYLNAGEKYFITISDNDDKYSIINGSYEITENNPTILNKDSFEIDDIKKYYEISINLGLSDKEIELQKTIKEKTEQINSWKQDKINTINAIYNGLDFSKYNEAQLIELNNIKEEELQKLESVANEYKNKIENSVRNDEELYLTYEVTTFSEKLNNVTPHYYHWFIVCFIAISLVLHFIFNKHVLINFTILPSVIIMYLDNCNMSKTLLIVHAGVCIVFTIIGLIFDSKYEEEGE